MECKKCHKACLESELDNGLCNDCIKKYGKYCYVKTSNSFASFCNILTTIFMVLNIISLFVFILYFEEAIAGIIVFIYGLFLIFFIKALSEIISLLEDIKNK